MRAAELGDGCPVQWAKVKSTGRAIEKTVRSYHGVSAARLLRETSGVRQAVAFGTSLHVSGTDAAGLERAITPYRRAPYTVQQINPGLEDVFIHLMESSKDNFAP